MKNEKVILELKELKPDENVHLTIQLSKKSLVETCFHNGTKFEKKFYCESYTNWRSAELVTESMTVSEIIDLLQEHNLNELCDLDFYGLTIEQSTDGSLEIDNIEWDSPLTEEEELDYTPNDLYWDSEITDSELNFSEGAIYSMTIKCGDYETQIED